MTFPGETGDTEMPEYEKTARAFLGELDEEEKADIAAQSREQKRARREAAVRSAQAILRQANRPVNRRDMLNAMEDAIKGWVAAFEKHAEIRTAVMLLAMVICKNILADGPLKE